jgi:hypothetical protein
VLLDGAVGAGTSSQLEVETAIRTIGQIGTRMIIFCLPMIDKWSDSETVAPVQKRQNLWLAMAAAWQCSDASAHLFTSGRSKANTSRVTPEGCSAPRRGVPQRRRSRSIIPDRATTSGDCTVRVERDEDVFASVTSMANPVVSPLERTVSRKQ